MKRCLKAREPVASATLATLAGGMPKSARNFRNELDRLLTAGQRLGFVAVDINAGKLHRAVGGYPGKNHRMPVCCDVMRRAMNPTDGVVVQPARRNAAVNGVESG